MSCMHITWPCRIFYSSIKCCILCFLLVLASSRIGPMSWCEQRQDLRMCSSSMFHRRASPSAIYCICSFASFFILALVLRCCSCVSIPIHMCPLCSPIKFNPPHPITLVVCLLLLALRVVVACIGGYADLGDLRWCGKVVTCSMVGVDKGLPAT